MVSGGGKRIADRGGTARSVYPTSRLLVWHSSFDHPRSRHASLVRGHAFNQQLEIILPSRVAADLAASLKWETSFFYEVTIPLTLLLQEKFIHEYILQGSFCLIAKNVAIDRQNTITILPTGELLLLIDNETYEQLGLVGHKYAQEIPAETQCAKIHRTTRRGQRYVVVIDLKTRAFTSSEPNAYRDRVRMCLETKFEPLTVFVSASNERGAPRTVIFGEDDTIERKRIEINGVHEQLPKLFVPALDRVLVEKAVDKKIDMTTLRTSLESVYDWLGAVACRLTELLQHQPLEEYVSTFDGVPDGIPMEGESEISVVRWRGLLSAEFVQRVLDRTREHVASGKIPWATVSVWGFADAIVSWQQEYEPTLSRAQERKLQKQHVRGDEPLVQKEIVNREHGYLFNGSNNYTFVVLPQHEYFVLQELGPHDATM